jgi:hypothetical protein
MTTRGKRIAFAIAIVAVLALPKRVPCECPGRDRCAHVDEIGRRCTPTDMEPLGVYLLELAVRRDVAIAYSTFDDCI